VIKLEYNVASTFNGEPVDGVFNNGFILGARPYTIRETGLAEVADDVSE